MIIDRDHALPITRLAELVGISWGNVYYLPRMASEADQPLMKRIDELNLAQLTSDDFTGALMARGVAISMDGKGAWRDNAFVERLWRSVKYEEV